MAFALYWYNMFQIKSKYVLATFLLTYVHWPFYPKVIHITEYRDHFRKA